MDLSQETRAFIIDLFDSVEAIEILLLLRRSPDTYWAAKAICEVLGTRPDLTEKKLPALAAAGLLKRGETAGGYRYAPANKESAARVDHLAEAYEKQRVDIINLIYSANLERLRAFSNAFKLKRE